jgi:hypothetical protein
MAKKQGKGKEKESPKNGKDEEGKEEVYLPQPPTLGLPFVPPLA